MIGLFNRFLNTWAARVFFLVLLVALVGWGVGDMLRNVGGGSAVATVGGQPISDAEFDDAFRRQMAQVTQRMGAAAPTPDIRRGVAEQVLDRLVFQASIAAEVKRLRLVVPDEALRQATFDIAAFKGPGGTFDHDKFLQILRANDLTEARFLDLMRTDLGQQELIEAVRAGVAAPDALTAAVFRYAGETRVAETVSLPFAGAAEPPAPTDAQLRRTYDNNPEAYTSPEYRRIQAVILSPETVAKTMDVSDAELHAAYEARKSSYVTPEKRSVQVLVAADEPAARKLAQAWRGGAGWDAMQDAAKAAGASSVALDGVTPDQIPSPDLAQAAFAAKPDQVEGPVHSVMGWQVLRVAKVTPGGNESFEQARDALRAQVAQSKAADAIYDRANKVQDAIASGSKLDELPGDLGLAAVSGTLDKQGDTPDGEPAPIPAPPPLRSALIAAAFAAHPGGQPAFNEVQTPGQPSAWYAVSVESVTPPAKKPFDAVQAQVRDDWTRDARHHEQDEAATRLLTAVQGGSSLKDAAALAGLSVTETPEVARRGDTQGVPPALVQPLFGLKQNEATMVETGDGFVVAQLIAVHAPSRDTDPVGYGRTRDGLAVSIGNDIELSYAAALRSRAKPRVNRAKLDSFAQAGS